MPGQAVSVEPIAPEQVERIIAAAIEGQSQRGIAAAEGLTQPRVQRLLKRPHVRERVATGRREAERREQARVRQARKRDRDTAAATPEAKAAAANQRRDPADLSRGKLNHYPHISQNGYLHVSNVWVGSLAPRPATAHDYLRYWPLEGVPEGLPSEPFGFGNPNEPEFDRPPLGWEPPRVKLRPPVGTHDRDVLHLTRNVRDPLEVERLKAEGWEVVDA